MVYSAIAIELAAPQSATSLQRSFWGNCTCNRPSSYKSERCKKRLRRFGASASAMSAECRNLIKIIPPAALDEKQRLSMFNHIFRKVAAHRDKSELYAELGCDPSAVTGEEFHSTTAYKQEINLWASALLENAWAACQEPGGGQSGRHIKPGILLIVPIVP